jgi:DNA-binding NarL/FixJ family response regulator
VGNQADPWPRLQEYQAAILEAEDDFRDEQLRGLRVQRHPTLRRVAWPRPGNFGVVFKVEGDAIAYAVKVFYHPQPDRQLRYRLIDQHLRTAAMASRLVSFAYDEAGIRVHERDYPTLRMEWANGDPLDTYLDRHLSDSASIDNGMFFEEWIATMQELKRSAVAHGDLQHKNILVQDNKTFRLVDYDGMFVPDMQEYRLTACEAGVSAYQHPQRMNGTSRFDERIDDFSALVVLLTLACVDADLWERYHEDGRLLLSEEDLAQPGESALFNELSGRKGAVGALANLIWANAEQGIDQVPPFGSVIRDLGMEWSEGAGIAANGGGSAAGPPPETPQAAAANTAEVPRLTYTQRQVAELLAAGKTIEETAAALGLFPATVSEYAKTLSTGPGREAATSPAVAPPAPPAVAPPAEAAARPAEAAAPPAVAAVPPAEVTARAPGPPPLSPRQQEVLDLLRTGLLTEQIAARLGVAPGTVTRHLSAIRTAVGNDEVSKLLRQASAKPAKPGRARTAPPQKATKPPQPALKLATTRPPAVRPQKARPVTPRPSPPTSNRAAPAAKRGGAGRRVAVTIAVLALLLIIIAILQSAGH